MVPRERRVCLRVLGVENLGGNLGEKLGVKGLRNRGHVSALLFLLALLCLLRTPFIGEQAAIFA